MADSPSRHASGTRRKPPRAQHQQGRADVQRNYASETDIPSPGVPSHDQPRLPRTPQKSASSSPVPVNAAGQTGSKPRPRNRTRPESISFSPNRPADPYNSGPRSSTATAFAGATFHASPAPSALPLPKFCARPGDSGATDKATAALSMPFQEPSPPATDVDTATPLGHSPAPAVRESPLEIMFRADRQEKERARQSVSQPGIGSPPNIGHSVSSSPYPSRHSPRADAMPPMPSSLPIQPHRRLQDLPNSGSPNSTAPSDGYMRHLGQPIGPAFSTPYNERIRAARGTPNATGPGANGGHGGPLPAATITAGQSQSEALKKLLFSPRATSQPAPQATTVHGSVPDGQPKPSGEHSSADVRSGPEGETRDARIVAMEDGLRKMLKMGS
jgi:hypothetical protein